MTTRASVRASISASRRSRTDERIRRDSFHSVPALVEAIELYILAHNRKSTPFVWTASADLILERVKKTL